MTEKQCKRCKKVLPLTCFYQHHRTKDGYTSTCIECSPRGRSQLSEREQQLTGGGRNERYDYFIPKRQQALQEHKGDFKYALITQSSKGSNTKHYNLSKKLEALKAKIKGIKIPYILIQISDYRDIFDPFKNQDVGFVFTVVKVIDDKYQSKFDDIRRNADIDITITE